MEREAEKDQCVVDSHSSLLGTLAHTTQAHALSGTRTHDPLVPRPPLNLLSYTSQD